MGVFKVKAKKREASGVQKWEGTFIQEDRKNILNAKSNFFIREAYKTLRTNVSFALTGEGSCKVVTVTSSMQGEGKSISTLNMAISYAMTDRRVLVIDCDLRRPKVARLLRMSSEVGLSNVIVEPELSKRAILHTEIPGLDVLLSGSIPPNPSELLSSPRMEHLLDQLRKSYDFIFLDTPPINMVTDAVVLAPKSDGVLMLVRANRAERGAVVHAVEQLQYAKTKILGFILNGVDIEKTHYGYKRYGYGRRYSYGKYGYGRYGYGYGSGYHYGYSSTMPPPYVSNLIGKPEEKEK